MTKVMWLKIAVLLPVFVLTAFTAAAGQITSRDDFIDMEKALQEVCVELDEMSQDLADEYLDILEQLQEIVEDYSEYISDLDTDICDESTISLKVFTEGLKSSRYAENHKELLSDIEDFNHRLKRMEDEHQDAATKADRRCSRIVRNLRREMNMLIDLAEDHVERVHEREKLDANIDLYLKEAIRLAIELQAYNKELIERTIEVPLVPPIPQRKKLHLFIPSIPLDRAKGEIGLVREFRDSLRVKRSDYTITVVNPSGDVHLTGWDKNIIWATLEIEVKAASRADEKGFASRSSLEMETSGNTYTVNANLPRISDPSTKILTSVLVVNVPSGNPVECRNAFGKMIISDLNHGAKATGQHSQISLENIRGNVSVENTMGPITLEDVTGSSIRAENSYNPIEITTCEGDMTIKNTFDDITLEDSRGQVTIYNSGDVTVRNHTGDVTITNTYGLVEVNRLDGNLRAINAYQPLIIRSVKGAADLENTHSKINAYDIGGLLSATNNFGQIWGEDLNGPLKVFGENGTIKLVFDRELHGSSMVTASYGTIDLAFRESSNIHLKARTVNGDIHTLLPLKILDEGTTKSMEHKFGQGRNPLAVSGRNTSIIISAAQ